MNPGNRKILNRCAGAILIALALIIFFFPFYKAFGLAMVAKVIGIVGTIFAFACSGLWLILKE